MAVVISGVFGILLGLALIIGGVRLFDLGGTWYFAAVGAGFLLVGILLLKRQRAALWLYALLMLAALGWALYEVGLDWWQLAPRGSLIAPFGLWLLMPWIVQRLSWQHFGLRAWGGAALPLLLAVVLWGVTAALALGRDVNDVKGMLPPPLAEATAPGEGEEPDGTGTPMAAPSWGSVIRRWRRSRRRTSSGSSRSGTTTPVTCAGPLTPTRPPTKSRR